MIRITVDVSPMSHRFHTLMKLLNEEHYIYTKINDIEMENNKWCDICQRITRSFNGDCMFYNQKRTQIELLEQGIYSDLSTFNHGHIDKTELIKGLIDRIERIGFDWAISIAIKSIEKMEGDTNLTLAIVKLEEAKNLLTKYKINKCEK